MLTRQQIQRIAQREHIGLQAQERDYIQHLLLAQLSNRSHSLVFKGGTALRIVYKGARYSEDLDFNAYSEVSGLQQLWREVVGDLGLYGIEAEVREEWQSGLGYNFEVSYKGPLFDGRDLTKSKVRVDISLRREVVESQRDLVNSVYDDVRPFLVTTLTPEHLVAEKVRALLTRTKPRDLYDLWLMHSKNWPVNRKLIDQKMSIYKEQFTDEQLAQAIARCAKGWERDMRPLLPQFVTYEETRLAVEQFLNQV